MNLFKAKNIPIPCGAIRIAFPHPCGGGLRGWVDFAPTEQFSHERIKDD